MGRGTLARKLVVRVATLVTVLALLLGTASTLAVRHIMLGQLDDQLDSALSTQDTGPGGGGGNGRPRGITQPGLPQGTLVVTQLPAVSGLTYVLGGRVVSGYTAKIDTDQAQALLAVESNAKRNVTVPRLGEFRAEKVARGGETDVVALPMASLNHAVQRLVALEVALSLMAIALSVLIARALVLRSLRPLQRLATTATEVSRLSLDRGEVALPVRVPEADARPDSEVGRVGFAFNHMLNNVEGALGTRQESETKVRQFVADASHELRNPLAAIRGYSELTRLRRDELPEDTRYALGRIEAESERMSRLVEDMLLLARLDNDPQLELARVDVIEVVLNAVSDAQVAGPGHHWVLDLPDREVVARADAQKLHQVVANLLANARKHTPQGTTVTTGVDVEGRWAVITVTDDGPGIDPAVRGHVFERFARADVARTHSSEGSTGLGLAIVTAVMDAHGGTATVDSVPGRTCFTLHVPLA